MWVSMFEIKDVITMNCVSQAMIIRKLIIKLLDKKRRGAIITVASTAGTFAFPYLQVYSGTKFSMISSRDRYLKSFHSWI